MTSLDLIFKYLLILELRFDTMLYSNLRTKIPTRAISNVHAGRIWPQVSRPWPMPLTLQVFLHWCGLIFCNFFGQFQRLCLTQHLLRFIVVVVIWSSEQEDVRKKKARNQKLKRFALIGLATAGGGALIGLTGGLAAPLVAAGAGGK